MIFHMYTVFITINFFITVQFYSYFIEETVQNSMQLVPF